MYDPKFRFMAMLCLILTGVWAWNILSNFWGNNQVFPFALYVANVLKLLGSALGGYVFIWLCVKFIAFGAHRKTGFEAEEVDEYGTKFNMRLALSKYLPEIIAPPVADPTLSFLEQELLGFWNGFRGQSINGEPLAANTHRRWRELRKNPKATGLHKAAALGLDLGKVIAFPEKRKAFPLIQPWAQDKITFKQQSKLHGGLTAFAMGQFDACRALPEAQRKALLTALRFMDTPDRMPANAPAESREIYEYVQAANAKALGHMGATVTEVDQNALNQQVRQYLSHALGHMGFHGTDASQSEAFYLENKHTYVDDAGLTKTSHTHHLWVPLLPLIHRLSPMFSPAVRTAFGLWQPTQSMHEPAAKGVVKALSNLGILETAYGDEKTASGTFHVEITSPEGTHLRQGMALLNIEGMQQASLRQNLKTQPRWQGAPLTVAPDPAQLVQRLQEKSHAMAEKLKGVFG